MLNHFVKAEAIAVAEGLKPHECVVMSFAMLDRMFDAGELPVNNSWYRPTLPTAAVGTIHGMPLYLCRTFMGVAFKSMLLAGIDGKKVLLVREDGVCDTVEWRG